MRPLLAAFLVLLWAACAGAAPPDSAKKGSPAELTPGIRGGGGTQRLECPKKADLSGLPRKAPTRAEYLKLVEGVVAEYGKKASRSRGPIDAVLRGATADGDGADLGALFLGLGAGPSAVYATAWSAKRNPDDPLTANNLGVTLKDMGDYRRALAVLLYADRLRPDAPLVLVNRAWVHYELGDFEGAKPLFEKVVRQAPESPSAHTGLGLIAHCRGDKTTAERHFRKALEARLPLALAAAWRGAQGRKGGDGKPRPAGEGPPKEDGELRLSELPSKASIKATAYAGPALRELGERLDGRLGQLMERKQELTAVVAKQWNRTSQSGLEGIVVYRSLETTEFLFRDIARLVFADEGRLGKATHKLNQWVEESSRRAAAGFGAGGEGPAPAGLREGDRHREQSVAAHVGFRPGALLRPD